MVEHRRAIARRPRSGYRLTGGTARRGEMHIRQPRHGALQHGLATAVTGADGRPVAKRGRIPGLLQLEVGVDSSRIDYACDVVLVSEFESQAALDAYASHPEHLRVKQELGDLRTHRYQVDYEVQGGP